MKSDVDIYRYVIDYAQQMNVPLRTSFLHELALFACEVAAIQSKEEEESGK